METPASHPVLRNKLPVIVGHPQLNNAAKQQSAEMSRAKETLVVCVLDGLEERLNVPISSSLYRQHNENRVIRPIFLDRIYLLSKHGLATADNTANGTNDAAFFAYQSTTSSMVAEASYAASEVDNEPLIDKPAASAVGRSKESVDKGSDLVFVGKWYTEHNLQCAFGFDDLDESIAIASERGYSDLLRPNDILHDLGELDSIAVGDEGGVPQQRQNLANKKDDVGWVYDPPFSTASVRSEPTLTDGLTVESESIFSHEHPADIAALPQDDRRHRPLQSANISTTDIDIEAGIDKKVLSAFNELPFASVPSYERPRGDGKSGGKRESQNSGRRNDASTSNDFTPSMQPSGSSSARGTSELKRGADEDGDDGADNNDKRGPRPIKRSKATIANKLLFACPFLKKDPQKHIRCIRYEISSTAFVRQHLKRCHYQPIFCPVCGEEFDTQGECHSHIKAQRCEKVEFTKEGISADQQKAVETCSHRNGTEVERWFRLWKIIFPEVKAPLSPYQLDTMSVVREVVLATGLQSLSSLSFSFALNSCLPQDAQVQANLDAVKTWFATTNSGTDDERRPGYDTALNNLLELEQGGNDLGPIKEALFHDLQSSNSDPQFTEIDRVLMKYFPRGNGDDSYEKQ